MSSKSIHLVAYYYMKPRGRVSTQKKGWMENQSNLSYDEKVSITGNLSKSDIGMAKVILDLTKKVVVRNGWNNNLDFDQVFEYYHKGYPQYTSVVMKELDPEYLKRFEQPTAPTLDSSLALSSPSAEIVEIDTSTVDTRVL